MRKLYFAIHRGIPLVIHIVTTFKHSLIETMFGRRESPKYLSSKYPELIVLIGHGYATKRNHMI